ncbi:MAG: glycosyltransferase [Xenococcaceae cyanobacterium MO_188.B19]|nr:glycosyltransferase [Xenococcaceae cyanobacterium MO_188.B19]
MTSIYPSSVVTGEYKRIMVYSHDAFGLGNIRRMLSICQYLLKSISNLSILLISGSPMVQSFRLPMGLDYIKLPCLNRGCSGKMAVKYLNADIDSILQLRGELILAAAKNYKPDLVLVDKKPLGIQGELEPTIDYLKTNLLETQFVLLLRDILDTPTKTIKEWQTENYYYQVESVYDRVLVVGMQKIFDICQEYQFNDAIASKVRFCGYIRKKSGLKNRRTIRHELNIKPDEKLVLVTPGGGEDGYFLINNYLTGLEQNRDRFQAEKIRSLIFCGAEMPPDQQQQIYQQAAKYPEVTVREFTDDMMSYINTANLVVSMCGYNTITEVLQKGKKAIVIPRVKPGQEQLIRAQSMAKVGLIKMIHPELLNPDLLMGNLFSTLNSVEYSSYKNSLNFAGLSKVSDYLTMLLFKSLYTNNNQPLALKTA